MPPVKKTPVARSRTFFREWREHRSLTQQDAAERLEIDPATLSRLENGKSPYNQDTLERMALSYGCDPEDLLAINPKEPDKPRLIYDRLRRAPPDLQSTALDILEAFLKKAS